MFVEQFKTLPEAIRARVTNGLGYRGFHEENSDSDLASWKLHEDALALYAHLGIMEHYNPSARVGADSQETTDYTNAANRMQRDALRFQSPEEINDVLAPMVEAMVRSRVIRDLIRVLRVQVIREDRRLVLSEEARKWKAISRHDSAGNQIGMRYVRYNDETRKFDEQVPKIFEKGRVLKNSGI